MMKKLVFIASMLYDSEILILGEPATGFRS